MTGVFPLRSIHKKGAFGDHHKKDESNLIQISEVKNLKIFQIVQFKKSTIQVKDISIDGVKFSETSLLSNSNAHTRLLWSGPRTWILTSSTNNIQDILRDSCNNENFAVTDLSHSRSIIQIKGQKAKEALKKGCPLDFNNFKKNNCATSVFHGITILIDMLDENPDTFNLFALRSFGESFYHSITDAALEDGYIGV